jgi:DNA-binding NtrC family response regulator
VEDGVGPDGGPRGARFVVVLPVAAPGDGVEGPPGAELADDGACRVLVVDDEALVRDAVVAMLRADGHDVRAAGSAEEVLAEPAWITAADVLVTDVLMPGVTGLELAERAVALHPGLRVVLMSGFLPEGPSWPHVADGAWDVLEKPFRVDDLRRVVARVRHRGAPPGAAA